MMSQKLIQNSNKSEITFNKKYPINHNKVNNIMIMIRRMMNFNDIFKYNRGKKI